MNHRVDEFMCDKSPIPAAQETVFDPHGELRLHIIKEAQPTRKITYSAETLYVSARKFCELGMLGRNSMFSEGACTSTGGEKP